MDYKERLEEAIVLLTEDKMRTILEELKVNIVKDTEEYFIMDTVCHKGDSTKLYYYKQTRQFMCYTHCGSMKAIDFLKKVWNVNFYEALRILRTKLGLSESNSSRASNNLGDFSDSVKECVRFFEKNKRTEKKDFVKTLYPEYMLERYPTLYKEEWIRDNISTEAMKQFNIRYAYDGDRVVIPHLNIDGELVGIRSRNFSEEAINNGMKYTPLRVEDKMCVHPLAFNLYGIYQNKENIKKKKAAVIVEGEKGVLQAETYYGRNNNITVATCGSNVSKYQRDMLLKLGIERVYIAFDKQWENTTTGEYNRWVTKIRKIVNMFSVFVEVRVVWDNDNLLSYKDCMYDKGYRIAQELFKKSYININSLTEQ